MLISLAIIMFTGLFFGYIFKKINLPSLVGMIFGGVLIAPLMSDVILEISGELRTFALVIILTRAGLSLDFESLKKSSRVVILLSFLPALFEMIAFTIFAPIIFGISRLDGLLMGSVIAAVSPAVIVPRMINIKNEGYGKNKNITDVILTGVSVDDIFVLIVFSSIIGLKTGDSLSYMSVLNIPISVITGILLGVIVGVIIIKFFEKFEIRDVVKIMILLSTSFLLLAIEEILKDKVMISALLSIITVGVIINYKNKSLAKDISFKYNELWAFAEILLFVLVGVSLDLEYALSEGFSSVFIILIALFFRMIGVLACLIKTDYSYKERIFFVIAYIPKATVQASIGYIPLSLAISSGQTILTVSIVSILITAPIGALLIDNSYKKLLIKK